MNMISAADVAIDQVTLIIFLETITIISDSTLIFTGDYI